MNKSGFSAGNKDGRIAPEVYHADDLAWEDRDAEAIEILTRYLSDGTDDVYAVNLLADCLAHTGMHEEALTLLDRYLAKRPDDPVLLGAKAHVRKSAGDRIEALALLDAALRAHDANPTGLGYSTPAEFRDALLSDRWHLLYNLRRFPEALVLAQSQLDADPATWHDNLITSLVINGMADEAEKLLAIKDAVDAPWSIAFSLVYAGMHEEAIPYFLRRLACVAKPVIDDFMYLMAYMECLLYARHFTELARMTAFWRQQRLTKKQKKCLAALVAAATFAGGDQAAGVQELIVALNAADSAKEVQRIRSEFHFEATGNVLLGMLDGSYKSSDVGTRDFPM